LTIAKNATTEKNVGAYEAKMQLIDTNGVMSDWLRVSLRIVSLVTTETTSATADATATATANTTNATVQASVDESIGLKYAEELRKKLELEQKKAKLDKSLVVVAVQPNAKIEKIDKLGGVEISFSKKMRVRGEFQTMAKGGQVKLGRILGVVPVSEIIRVDVIAGDDNNKDKLDFSWQVESFTATRLRLQLKFEQPLFVSVGVERESLRVWLNQTYFIDEDQLPLANATSLMTQWIPKQYADAST